VVHALQWGVVPGLAVILVGNNPASHLYVRNKIPACKEVGIQSRLIELALDVEEAELLGCIDRLNADNSTHGILI
jgi:methylenetetrahydrofolate dehydrogenase (NADP+)/methenyltetrahydrofolate cyclohydrolase